LAPRADAVSKSRINPKILENNIPELLVKMALNIGFFFVNLRNFNKGFVKISLINEKTGFWR